MPSFGRREMQRLYRFTRATLAGAGVVLAAYGTWFFVDTFLIDPKNAGFWLGMLPIYIGCMMILVSLAMKEDWFTNARKYW